MIRIRSKQQEAEALHLETELFNLCNLYKKRNVHYVPQILWLWWANQPPIRDL